MLKKHIDIDENTTVGSFLKDVKDKKNMHYFILDTKPKTFVDVRTISLKLHDSNEKFKTLKKSLSISKGKNTKDYLLTLIESGDRVIGTNEGYFDFIDALNYIFEQKNILLKIPLQNISRKEIFALNENDKISVAKNLFVHKRVNILPVIEGLKLIGEVRTIDLLTSDLFTMEKRKGSMGGASTLGIGNVGEYHNENYKNSVTNLPITNIMNKNPLQIKNSATLKDAVEIMLKKKIPSIIVTENENLYSIVSYKDVFRLYMKETKEDKFTVEYIGVSELYEDEFDLIQDYTEKSMKKIVKLSKDNIKYDQLKLSIKIHGNTKGTHQKKLSINLVLSHGNHVMHVNKEIVKGTSDENRNDKVKGKWNVPLMAMEALGTLEKKVTEEKRKFEKNSRIKMNI